MKKKADLLLLALVVIFSLSVVYAFLKFFVFHSYSVLAETSCDPESEACFVYECDPEAEECTGDPVEDTSYFKLIRKDGENIEACNPAEEECQDLVCGPAEENCEEILCSDDTFEEGGEGVFCNDPETYEAPEEAEGEEGSEEVTEEDASEGEGEVSEGSEEEALDETSSEDGSQSAPTESPISAEAE